MLATSTIGTNTTFLPSSYWDAVKKTANIALRAPRSFRREA